jgi:hypothetical protein
MAWSCARGKARRRIARPGAKRVACGGEMVGAAYRVRAEESCAYTSRATPSGPHADSERGKEKRKEGGGTGPQYSCARTLVQRLPSLLL